jgi:hypothetical protein
MFNEEHQLLRHQPLRHARADRMVRRSWFVDKDAIATVCPCQMSEGTKETERAAKRQAAWLLLLTPPPAASSRGSVGAASVGLLNMVTATGVIHSRWWPSLPSGPIPTTTEEDRQHRAKENGRSPSLIGTERAA